ncbi:hypothetical protein AB688_19675 [Pseudomonas putida]|uniref:hypothetical protein n=1 Tax=Pseudomonas putida TaxID=303 RepID=UPI0007B6B816|nr:hypothetical protein [Pseudomonas putida]ANC04201.1 hypothetical protein AB688_19675 [Pseudomonas putida]
MSTNDHPTSCPEERVAAWLGQAGLYRTRLEAVQNGGQLLKPINTAELIDIARNSAKGVSHE